MRSWHLVASLFVTCTFAKPAPTYTSGTAAPATHTITVGKGGVNAYEPNSVSANVGDIVVFQFYPANHSVIKAEYGFPCIPYEDLGPGLMGFFSGFVPVVTGGNTYPTWNITINDTQPLFYYCSAPGSCIENGMVGAINPNTSTPVNEQIALAKQAKYMLQPGEPFPSEAAASATSVAASATTVTATATATSPSIPTLAATPKKSALSAGAIAGIAISGAALLAFLGALIYYISRARALTQASQHTQPASAPMSYNPSTANGPASPLLPSGTLTPATQHDGRFSHPLPPYDVSLAKHLNGEETGSLRSGSPPTGYPGFQGPGAWLPVGAQMAYPAQYPLQRPMHGQGYWPGYFDGHGNGVQSLELHGVSAGGPEERVGVHELGIQSPVGQEGKNEGR